MSIKKLDGFLTKSPEWFKSKFPNQANHQGIAALIEEFEEYDISDICNAKKILILDQITDIHNLGAIVRSAAVFGFYYIIIMDKNSVDINSTVYKIASGGMEFVKIIKVTNISNAIKILKKNGFWVIGLDEHGNASLKEYETKNSYKIALVIGAEGNGIRRLVKENCDELLYIKPFGKFSTLNASNACSIAMYHFC